jgi:PAS domain S-box-containing protein
VYTFDRFTLEDAYSLAAQLRQIGASASDSGQVAVAVVTHLFEHLRSAQSGAPACPLVRLFRSTSWSALSDEGKAVLRPTFEREPEPQQLCLALEASRGVVPEWNDPSRSRAHRFLLLGGPATPMLSALFAQLGVSVDAPLTLRTGDKLCDVFHVEDALASPMVPDQDEFVRRYGIRSVMGIGGILAGGEMFVVVLFCSVHVPREVTDLFRLVAPSVGLALIATRHDTEALEHRLKASEELLHHHEKKALAHVRQQRDIAERLTQSEAQARVHARELGEGVKRLEAHHAVTRALAESSSMVDAIPRILTAVGQALGCSLGYAWQPDSTGERLELVGTWPSPMPLQFVDFVQLTRASVFAREVGLPGRVWTTGAPAWLVEVTDDPNFPRARAARKVGLHTGIAFPAVLEDGVGCVFEMFSGETHARDEEIVRVLARLGDQIGQFIARTRAREALELSDARKRTIFEGALDCIVSMNAAGAITEFNPAAERTFGYRREDVLGKDMASLLIPPSFRTMHRRGLAHNLATGESRILAKRVDFAALRADQTTFPIELAVTRMDVPAGPMFTAFIRDTTDRKQAAEERERAADALRASEYRFRTLTKQAPVGIIATDCEGRCDFVNERWCTIAGMNPEQAMDHGWRDAIHPEDRQSVLAAYYDATTTGSDFAAQYRLRTRQGTVTWVQGAALPLRSNTGELTGYLGTVTDVTERIQRERVAQFLADATSALNASLDYEAALNAVAKLAVPTLADCCTAHVVEDGVVRLVAIVHADTRVEALAQDLARWYATEKGDEMALSRDVRAMKAEVVTEVTEDVLSAVVLSPAEAAAWRSMVVRSYVSAPLVVRGRVTGAIHLMMGESGRSFGQGDLPFVVDLANRAAIAVENARLYRQAQEAVVARDEFLSIASHELRTPLAGIQLGMERVMRMPTGNWTEATLTPLLRRIERSTKRLSYLAEDLLDVTRGQGTLHLTNVEDVDLRTVIDSVLTEMHDDIARSGSKVSVDASGFTVGCWERRRLDQVVTNLLSNALKYGSKKPIALTIDATEENRVTLRICDHGIGIPTDQQSHIFERFRRAVSAERYRGFGLGLWIVRQIVEAHGGTITVTSEPGRLTIFTVELPRSGPRRPVAPDLEEQRLKGTSTSVSHG